MITVKIPEYIVKKDLSHFKDIENRGGNYIFYNEDTPCYVGKCSDLRVRIYEHMIGITNTSRVFGSFKWVKFFYEDCPMNRDIYETYLINTVQPVFNKNKAYIYKPKYDGLMVFCNKPTKWERPIKRDRCQHIKANGEQCKNYVSKNGYCGIHFNNQKIVS